MRTHADNCRPGFTLIELLTVIAIIALLIGILVPSLSAARDQAKNARTRGQLQAIETGCQTFQNDNGLLPKSGGLNPFQEPSQNAVLTGAQWVALQLVGADAGGYVKSVISNDSGGSAADGVIDEDDWNQWYSLTPDRQYGRVGPYVTVDGKIMRSPEKLVLESPSAGAVPADMMKGDGDWPNQLISFFIDSFDAPILYYRANDKVKDPFTTGTPGTNFKVGKYDHSDNALITGQDESNGAFAAMFDATMGWDVAGRGDLPNGIHPLGVFGYDVSSPNKWPEPGTFAATLSDRNVWETTRRGDEGKIQPYKGDRFILISAGKDGLYGTPDDVKNFEASDN